MGERFEQLEQSLQTLQQNYEVLQQKHLALQERQAHLDALAELSPDLIYVCNPDGSFLSVNQRFCEVTGLSQAQILSQGMSLITTSHKLRHIWLKTFEAIRAQGIPKSFEHTLDTVQESGRMFHTFLTPIFQENGCIKCIVGNSRDITQLRRAERTIGKLTHYDSLTGLANRTLFIDRLHMSILYAARNQKNVAVVCLDIDHFQKVNTNHGHLAGDEVFKQVGQRLRKIVRKNETAARFNSDSFTILLQDVQDQEGILLFVDRLNSIFEEPYQAGQHQIYLTCSIGISIFPQNGTQWNDLLKRADSAMYKAKASKKNKVQFYDMAMQAEAQKRGAIANHLHRALDNQEFSLVYQPLIHSLPGEIKGFEALLRWDNPVLGTLEPLEFLWLAEESDLILTIGEWVLRSACQQTKAWHDTFPTKPSVSVNVSPVQMKHKGFVALVQSILEETGLAPQYLELDVTERALLDCLDDIIDTMLTLQAMGIRIALDDFGSQYSSFHCLKKLPIDLLKIGRSLIQDLKFGAIEIELIRSIISLAHKLNVQVVAKGVETTEQLLYLIDLDCDYLQGYFIHEPQLPEYASQLLHAGVISLWDRSDFLPDDPYDSVSCPC